MPATLDWYGCATFRLRTIDTDIKPIRAALERLVPRPELLELGYVDGTVIL